MNAQLSLSQHAALHAKAKPEGIAFIEGERRLTWAAYHAASNSLAVYFSECGLVPGERIAIYLPDGIDLHIALLASEKAGLIALGIGGRAGLREVEHLLGVAEASSILSWPHYRGNDMKVAFANFKKKLPNLRNFIPFNTGLLYGESVPRTRPIAINDLFLLNSTSGTTGMPKCVAHDQARWYAFHQEAVGAAALGSEDVFLGAAPPPFGFGLWTTHITPLLLGSTTVKLPAFDAESALKLIGKHQVSVLSAVSTQFIMMLNSPALQSSDLNTLRIMFTGGERVPYRQAADFEAKSGATVLQFYGSNETGAFTNTTLSDPQEKRLTTAGRIINCMDVRLFDDNGQDVTSTGSGRPGGKGPLLSRGYYNDQEASEQLYTTDGYMLMEDLVHIDREGYLTVAGRKGDFIIRGGKNISCAAVEEVVGSHPAIAMAAAVAAPDPIFGEKVMLFAKLRDGQTLDLASLADYLICRQVSKELIPEYLSFCDELPRSSGGKVAKGELRNRARHIIQEQSRES